MIEKHGMSANKEKPVGSSSAKKRKKEKLAGKEEEPEEDEEKEKEAKKAKKKPEALVPENQSLVDTLAELCGFEFKGGDKFKGVNLSKACKSLREHEEEITSGKQAEKLKGIGKSTGKKIDQFLEEGKIDRLEEFRAGNL